MAKRKNAAAVALSRLRMEKMTPEQRQEVARAGGRVGGLARAKTMTKAERQESARKAAQARWGGKEATTPEQRSESARKAGLAGGRGRKKEEKA